MSFKISGLDPAQFHFLYGLTDRELETNHVKRVIASDDTGFPERVELREARKGESLLLLNYVHQPIVGPYRSSHAILIREGARAAYEAVNEVPQVIRSRVMSLRAFDDHGCLDSALLVPGTQVEHAVEQIFCRRAVAYIHAHYAAYGCYAARIDRADTKT
jgi:hypothetical protein